MEYLIPVVLVLLILAGAVTLFVLNATRKGGSNADDGGAPGVGTDHTPLGDTAEHAGDQTSSGGTVRQPEATPAEGASAGEARRQGGEGEGARRDDDPRSESERLANRPA